jgi:hypothetical protein
MKMDTRAFVLLLLLGLAAPVAEAITLGEIFNLLLGPLWNLLVQATCNSIRNNFNDGFRLGCKCRGLFSDGGLGGELVCQNDADYCLINNPIKLYCGKADLSLDFSLREGVTSLEGCFAVESNLPNDLQITDGTIPICATVIPTGTDFQFKSCSIDWDGEQCASCTVCENKRDFKFNCSNINVNPLGGAVVEGPALTSCEGFGFLDDI